MFQALALLLKVIKTMPNILAVGDIIITKFPSQNPQGREQEGIRPVRAIDLNRVISYLGTLANDQYQSISYNIQKMLLSLN